MKNQCFLSRNPLNLSRKMSQNHEKIVKNIFFMNVDYVRKAVVISQPASWCTTLSCFDRENANDNTVMSRSAVSFKANYREIKQNSMKNHHFWMVSKSSWSTFFLFCELAIENALKPFKRWHNIDFPYSFVEADFENIYFSSSCWQIHTLDVAENVVNLIVN